MRLDEWPFGLNVAFQGDVSGARVPKKVGWCTRRARVIKVRGRCAYNVSRLNKLSNDEALRFRVVPAPLSQAASTNENIHTFISNLGNIVDAEQNGLDLRVLFLKRGHCT